MEPVRCEAIDESPFGHCEELRCVIAIIRHDDRTPKQKVKLKVTEEKLLNLMLKYNGGRPRAETKLKSAVQLQDLLDATRILVPRSRPDRESDSEAEDVEHAEKLRQVKAVLEEPALPDSVVPPKRRFPSLPDSYTSLQDDNAEGISQDSSDAEDKSMPEVQTISSEDGSDVEDGDFSDVEDPDAKDDEYSTNVGEFEDSSDGIPALQS